MALNVIGVDLGSLQDHSAICVAQVIEQPRDSLPRDAFSVALGWQEPVELVSHYYIRALEQLDLGIAYASIARRVAMIATRLFNRDSTGDHFVVVDATGVGRPVLEMIREIMIPQVHVCGVTITASARKEGSTLYRDECHLGKSYLARRLQVLIQDTRVHWHKDDLIAPILVKELQDYQIRVTKAANDEYGAFTAGAHDDVITAVALATMEDASRGATLTKPLM